MALFVDGPICTIDDLTDEDSGLLDVAQAAGINVTTKIRLGQGEIAGDLQLWLSKPRRQSEALWSPLPRMEQIVATPALKRWGTMHALGLVYRDAFFSQLVDRYQAKWQAYTKAARDARESFIAGGLALASDPVVRAQSPILATLPAPQSGGTFYASVAWVNQAGQEGDASEAASLTVPDGSVMTVRGSGWPANATAMRVYAGASISAMVLQNSVDLPVDATYTYIPGQVIHARLPGAGQTADVIRQLARVLLRG